MTNATNSTGNPDQVKSSDKNTMAMAKPYTARKRRSYTVGTAQKQETTKRFTAFLLTGAPKGFRNLSSLFSLPKEIRWNLRSVQSESSCQSQTSNNIFLQAEMQLKPENTNQPLTTNQPGANKTRPVGSSKLCRFCKNAWITSCLQRSQDR